MKKKYKVRDKGEPSERTQKELINACTPDGLTVCDEAQNAIAIKNIYLFSALPPVDIENAAEVEDRMNQYFLICCQQNLKPTPSSFALSLGLSRQAVAQIKCGRKRVPKAVYQVIDKGSTIMDALMEQFMLEGKINIVGGIFMMKNNNGYVDKVENHSCDSDANEEHTAAEIKEKYKHLID